MEKKLDISLVGGDRRQVELVNKLASMGHNIKIMGLDNIELEGVRQFKKVTPQLFDCKILLLPIPYKRRDGFINIKESGIKVTLDDMMANLGDNKPWIVMGKGDKEFKVSIRNKRLEYIDLLEEESFSILNAISTAEGAIQKAMEMTRITIHGSRALVLGYGRIGKSLSRMLKGIGAYVSVEARKREDLAWIEENGYVPVHLKELIKVLPYQDIIFNTIPSLILDKEKLLKVKETAKIIDVSSYPGGVDFQEAKKLGIEASLNLGLPGIVAPKTSAEVIYKVMFNCLRDWMI